MKLRPSLLLAGLLALPASLAGAVPPAAPEMYINVPYEMTGIPLAAKKVLMSCRVGVGPVSGEVIWNNEHAIGGGGRSIDLPTAPGTRSLRGVARIIVHADPGRKLSDATHYTCRLQNVAGQPEMKGESTVTGAIPRT